RRSPAAFSCPITCRPAGRKIAHGVCMACQPKCTLKLQAMNLFIINHLYRKTGPILAAIIFAIMPALCVAQGFNVTGTVMDGKDNQSLIGVIISLSPQGDSTVVQNAVTDIDGAFSIPNVSPGTYIMKA